MAHKDRRKTRAARAPASGWRQAGWISGGDVSDKASLLCRVHSYSVRLGAGDKREMRGDIFPRAGELCIHFRLMQINWLIIRMEQRNAHNWRGDERTEHIARVHSTECEK